MTINYYDVMKCNGKMWVEGKNDVYGWNVLIYM